MYTIYQSSPRRSPRQLTRIDHSSNTLKTKTTSPIRKSKTSQSQKKALPSANALAAVTRPTSTRRHAKVNDENKENCGNVMRTRTTRPGVNANTKKDGSVVKTEINRRMPLKEIPLNGFVERLRKRDIVPSVEITVFTLVI